MNRTILLCLLLTGCSSINRFTTEHPRATVFIITSVGLSAVALNHNSGHREIEPRISTPLVSCANPETCK